jgi:hypothetical protein
VQAVRFEAPHNYNRDSREAVYVWMARWLQNAPADVKREERPFAPEPLGDLLVFYQRPMPDTAVSADVLTRNWIDAARRQLQTTPTEMQARALRLALGFADSQVGPAPMAARRRIRTVLAAGVDPDLQRQLKSAGFMVRAVDFTPFDEAEAAKIPHFDSYNRTKAGQRVADIVAAMRAAPDSALVASGDEALAGLLASAVETDRVAVLDVANFDTSSDTAFVERLYIPGLRRAGDVSTAARLAGRGVVLHNGGEAFRLESGEVRRGKLSAREIVDLLKRTGR